MALGLWVHHCLGELQEGTAGAVFLSTPPSWLQQLQSFVEDLRLTCCCTTASTEPCVNYTEWVTGWMGLSAMDTALNLVGCGTESCYTCCQAVSGPGDG